jgi:hypothetical protein
VPYGVLQYTRGLGSPLLCRLSLWCSYYGLQLSNLMVRVLEKNQDLVSECGPVMQHFRRTRYALVPAE